MKVYRLPHEQAADFYVYVFDNGRIFARLKTFEGRNAIQFRTFLFSYVLKCLFVDWQRTQKEIETISLGTTLGNSEDGKERTLEDILLDPTSVEHLAEESTNQHLASEIVHSLEPHEQLLLKLLSLIECDLAPGDFRLLAQVSGRTILDTVGLVTEIQQNLRHKDEKVSQLHDNLAAVNGWIRQRQQELHEVSEKIRLLSQEARQPSLQKLLSQKEELQRALTKRYRQRERLVQELHALPMTTPYKDIARLLNITVGTACSRIARLRARLLDTFGERWTAQERQP
jgi:hypothetical protein